MFNYNEAFGRNIGLISAEDMETLHHTKIAILGVGGVGGRYAEALVRLGCENLLITDVALFDPPDLNRQFSSSMKTMDRTKVECVGEAIKDINPEVQLKQYYDGVTLENYKEIVDWADIIMEAIDVTAGNVKQKLNEYAYETGKPIVSNYLVGQGAICLVYDKRYGISFNQYFGLNEDETQETFFQKLAKGVYPNTTSDINYNNAVQELLAGKGHIPSSTANSYIAGALGVMALRGVLFENPKIPYAPYYQQIDLFDMKYYVEQYNCQED